VRTAAGGATEAAAPPRVLTAPPAHASWPKARPAVATIDGKMMLEAAKRAVGLLVVAQRRAAGSDGIGQHCFDGRHQPLCRWRGLSRPRCQTCRALVRSQAGAGQGLPDVDVAEPGDDALVHQ